MSRYDKYDGYVGNFRAPLAAAWDAADKGKAYGVGLNSSGQIVKGKGNVAGIRGVLILTEAKIAGEIVDVMRHGEITEFSGTAGVPGTDFGTAGTDYYAHGTTGVISTATTTGSVFVGFTVEGSRLIVDVDSQLT